MNAGLRRANDLYNRSQKPSGSRRIKTKNLEDAIALYRTALRQASTENVPSLQKNLGLSHYRLADLFYLDVDLPMKIFHFSEAIEAMLRAWISRPEEQNTEWGGRLEELISDCFEKVHRSLNGDPSKFHYLDKLRKSIGNGPEFEVYRIRLHLANGQFLYRCGVKILERHDYKDTQRMVEYARFEYELAVQSARSIENKSNFSLDLSRLHEDIAFLKRSCDSIKLRQQADQMFDDHVMQSEGLNWEMVWVVLDMYKAAEMHSRDLDIESEAIALSRQGRLFNRILKLPSKAHKYYRTAFDLAVALHPRNMNNCDWYMECKAFIEEQQKAKVREEEARKAKDRAPYLEKMKNTLDALKAHSSDSYDLLKYIYANHPPKVNHSYKAGDVNSTNIKKTLLNAIIQYHPDKQIQYDMEWRVLSEEITKYLNVRYESFKGC